MFSLFGWKKQGRRIKSRPMVSWKPRLELLEDRTVLDIYLGNYGVSYFYQAAGRNGDPNPYYNVQVSPGPYYIDASPGKYYVVTTGNGAHPAGGSLWSGDASSGTHYGLDVTPGSRVDFTHTHGQIVLYAWDWYPWDNDPTWVTYFDLYKVSDTPDIAMQSAQLLNGNTVQYTYQTTGNPGSFQVGLFQSADGKNYDPSSPILTQPVTPSPTNPQAPGTFTINPATFQPDPTKPYLVVAADPNNAIAESDETNNTASVLLPDIALNPTTSLAWDGTNGGVNFTYTVNGSPTLQATTAMLYWASGPTQDDIIDPALATPITIAQGTFGQQSIHFAPSDFPGGPAPGATYLLAVADPDNKVVESDETNNVQFVNYDSTMTIAGKYDGDPDPAVIGRFFPGPGLIPDETLTVTVSDSVAALRPTLVVNVGGNDLVTAPKVPLLGSWDGRTFETATFDPGVFLGDTAIQARAFLQQQTIDQAFATLEVEPIPDWLKDLSQSSRKFEVDTTGHDGSYVFAGLLGAGLNLSHRVDGNVPFVGGRTTEFSADLGVTVRAFLNPTIQPQSKGYGVIRLTVLDVSVVNQRFDLPDSAGTSGNGLSLSLSSGYLDPLTLVPQEGVTLTVKYRVDALKKSFNLGLGYYTFIPVGPIPVLVGIRPVADLDIGVLAQLQVSYQGGSFVFVPGGNSIGAVITGGPRLDVTTGWFLPNPRIVRTLLTYLGLAQYGVFVLGLEGALAGAISFKGLAYYGGSVGTASRLYGELDVTFDVFGDAQLVFDVGGVRLWSSPKATLHFPGLPYTKRILL
jgi:hypothetical protein